MYTTESCTFDVKAFWNQFQTLDLFAVKIIYNDNDNYAGTQNCRYGFKGGPFPAYLFAERRA